MPLSIPDQTIAAQVKVPDMMHSLNSVMQYRNAQQNLQTNQLDYQIKDQANQKLNALRDLAASPGMTKADGSFDNAKFAGQAGPIDPVQGQEMAGKALSNQSAGIGNESKQFALHKDYADTMLQTAQGALQDKRITAPVGQYDAAAATDALTEAMNQAEAKGVPKAQALLAIAPFVNAVHQPGAIANMLKNSLRGQLGAQGQAAVGNPAGVAVTNNQQSSVINTNQFSDLPVGAPIPGTSQQAIPSVTTEITDPDTGLKKTVGVLPPSPVPGAAPASATREAMQIQPTVQQGRDGEAVRLLKEELANETNPANRAMIQRSIIEKQMGQPKGQPQQAAAQSYSFPTSQPTGVSAAITGTQDSVNKHFTDMNDRAKNASQDIGILQNIISHAHGAATGVGSERQALAQAIMGKLGNTVDASATTDTNLLSKNAAMLQLAGGDTNLAKTIAGAANPNGHMDESALKQAAYQVIGQKKMDLAGQKLFAPLKQLADHGSPEAYNQIRQKFDSASDPRIMQLPYMNPEEVKKMRASMTPQEQKEFRDKITTLHSLGIKP